ncbi:phospholipase [Pseudomonas sp. v388]|uniref:alpha/beta hydrolase n=1 Tax=Pseudomonas sp. v388 TaxID=2479849 RepID=UPI000F784303|nr:dienelactone hydrolase family protein [Pseudomonas sp. v388]RRV04476.1 phospholipase [Pseudomonas sp. v388]
MLKYLAALLLACSGLVHAQDSLHTDLTLSYLAEVKADAPQRPLVIFIHGYGSNEQDLFGIKDRLSGDYNFLSVRAPMELRPGSYKWFTQKTGVADYDGVTEDLKNSGERLTTFIRQVAQKYHTPADKVFLVGFSQGAMMSYEVALRDPTLVGGFAALSGRLLPVLESSLQPDPRLAPLKVFIGHGEEDHQVAYSGGPNAEATLKKLGVQPQFHAYEGLAHSINAAEVADLARWLEHSAK